MKDFTFYLVFMLLSIVFFVGVCGGFVYVIEGVGQYLSDIDFALVMQGLSS